MQDIEQYTALMTTMAKIMGAVAIALSPLTVYATAVQGSKDAIEVARKAFNSYRPDYCDDQFRDSESIGDKAYSVEWLGRDLLGNATQSTGYLVRLFCVSGAYNVTSYWYIVDNEGTADLLDFATPHFENGRLVGMSAVHQLVNSDFNPQTKIISSEYLWRGIGDARTVGTWKFEGGTPVLKRFEIDSDLDEIYSPKVVYDADQKTK